jgi:hypothetical protein
MIRAIDWVRSPLFSPALFAACGRIPSQAPIVEPPASLTIVSDDQRQATIGSELSQPLVVKVINAMDSQAALRICST